MTLTGDLGPGSRKHALDAMASGDLDVLVVGAGVVGAGAALDAVSRGLSTALVEQRDFASGTSSRSSKLVHGGLRYLEMFDFALVKEALEERGLLLTRLAPHLVRPVPFLYPLHHTWERPYVGAGLMLYDAMAQLGAHAGKHDMGVPRHKHVFRRQLARMAPDLRTDELTGAIRYYDCQVDDARLVMNIARTAAAYGAHVASRTKVVDFLREGDRVVGARVVDLENDREVEVRAKRRHQRRRRLDQRDPGHARRPRSARRRGQQGHPPRRPARPDPQQVRLHHQDRDVRPVRDPVGPALDHRHHGHAVGPRPRAPRGLAQRTSTTCSST